MKICYVDKNFRVPSLLIIQQANEIIDEYAAEGMMLTLRQLYYQFVSRDLIENKQKQYKRLGDIISAARLAGLVDWEAIEDRGRSLKSYYHNTDPGDAVRDSLNCYCLDKWEDQTYRPEVWIEKEALLGVITDICIKLDVPCFACKGYVSQSAMWQAGHKRMLGHINNNQIPIVIHLGDHDPSGIHMTEDIERRLDMFSEDSIEVVRIALNMDQIEEHGPPPNDAKLTDPRSPAYIKEFGPVSWELDALDPRTIRDLIKDTVEEYTDRSLMDQMVEREKDHKIILKNVVDNWKTL